jgi:pimeloyl-ACP methyl ester carboxylesterase
MKKWIRRISLSFLILTVIILVAITTGMKAMRFTDNDAQKYFEENGFSGEIKNLDINGRSIKIIAEDPQDSDSILMVFVHGAPGTWDAFKAFVVDKDLKDRTRIIAYDRPGYGGSGEKAMPGIQEQAEVLRKILDEYGMEKNVLVGHSYGGPIIAKTALECDSKTNVVIMIAPLNDPESEPLFWYSYFSYWKLTSWFLPSELVVAGAEKFAHTGELTLMKDQWKDAHNLFVHVHGLKDGLAPGKENIAFSKRHIPGPYLQTIVYEDKGHLLIWTDFSLMKKIILSSLDSL